MTELKIIVLNANEDVSLQVPEGVMMSWMDKAQWLGCTYDGSEFWLLQGKIVKVTRTKEEEKNHDS